MKRTQSENRNHRDYSRRDFLKTSGLAAGAVGALALDTQVLAQEGVQETKTNGLPVKGAGYTYSRVQALISGQVKIDGCDLSFQPGRIGDLNSDMLSGPQTMDFSEVGLHPFMLAYANDDFRDYTLLPIFPLRVFRHKSVFVRTDRGIEKPEDLRDRRIATPNYSSTSLTWLRGIFQDEYGISPADVHWVAAAADSSADLAGQTSRFENTMPEGVEIEHGTPGLDESDLLESGEVDALFHAIEPRAFVRGDPIVRRLFPDYRSVERAYFAKTGIFPIMHAVAIKNATLEQNPWFAKAVFKAYSQARHIDFQKIFTSGGIMDSLPWYGQELEETRALMGDNYYSYGIEPNRKTLHALFRYSHQQGLSSRELTIEELFEPSSLGFSE